MEINYQCSELLAQYGEDILHTTTDYQMLEHRIEVLTYLINCGIECTTLSQLNNIH